MCNVRRLTLVMLAAGVSIGLIVCGTLAGAQDIKLGFTPPLTGGSAAQGSNQSKAIKLALKQINEAGGVNGKKIDLRIVDNQSTNPGALAALQKAVEQEKVLALVSFVKSTQILATSDAVKSYGIPTVVGGTNVRITHEGNPWLFRVRPDDSIAAGAIVKYIKEDTKLKKVGILHDSDAFGTGGADLVEKGANEAGLVVVKREKYTTKEKDYTAQLLSIKNAGTEIMVLYVTNPEDAAIIIRQYRQLGSPFKFIGTASAVERDSLVLAKEQADGILGVTDYVPGSSPVYQKYASDYRKEYNEDADPTSAWTFDGLNILVNAIKKGGEGRAKIREAILGTRGYKGVLGTYNFTPNGNGLSEVSIIQVEKGKHKLVKIVNVGTK